MLIAIVALLASCSSSGSSDGANSGTTYTGTRQWTYMVYMGADNNLSDGGLYNLNDMELVGSSAGVAIVVQAEFSPRYTTGITGLTSETGRVYVENDHNPNAPNLSAGTLIGNVDMANPATLTAFITWAKTNYPAQHYALVIWDHGAGWKAKKLTSPLKGAVTDESAASSGALMSLPNLAKAVADSGVHFDIINFDACLMAMYEVAYEFKGLTDYMAFSEHTEPGTGDPYQPILAALTANPTMSARTLSSIIVDKFNEFYVPNTREETTKSAIDMAQLAALDTKIIALSQALTADASTKTVVQAAQLNTQKYAYPANHDLYDFCSYVNANMVSGSAKTICGEIVTLLGSVVINSKYTGAGVAKSHGLAIYLPQATETSASDITDYGKLKCNLTTRASAGGTWGSYIENLLGATPLLTYGVGDFALYLSWTKPNGSACDADLDLYIFEPDGSGGGKVYSPWMGQTSPNGFFSQESSQAGKSEEFYIANAQVIKGDYYFLANYYASSPTCTQAAVHIKFQDPVTVNGTWTEPWPAVLLDLSNKIPTPNPCTNLACFNTYSDWWVPGFTTRLFTEGVLLTSIDLPIHTRNSQFIFRNQRGGVLQGITQ